MTVYDRLGRIALRFAYSYLRGRYRREIRIGFAGAGVAAVLAVVAYVLTRDVPEG